MSRIGKKPIPLPSGVKVDVKGNVVNVTGPKGSLSFTHPDGVSVTHVADANQVQVDRAANTGQLRAFHGMTRALINNMVVGVTEGYQHKMEIYGTGYGCNLAGRALELNVGFANTVKLKVPEGVEVNVEVPQARGDETPARLTISGIDKQRVGQFAREIKDVRPPEPYKGKGVRYADEKIRRKAGKAFAGAGG